MAADASADFLLGLGGQGLGSGGAGDCRPVAGEADGCGVVGCEGCSQIALEVLLAVVTWLAY